MASGRTFSATQLYMNDIVINDYMNIINKHYSNVYAYNSFFNINVRIGRFSIVKHWRPEY